MIISLACTGVICLVSGHLCTPEKPGHKRGWARFELGTTEKSRDGPNVVANQKARNKDLKYNKRSKANIYYRTVSLYNLKRQGNRNVT